MKIIVKQLNWNKLKTQVDNERIYEFSDIELQKDMLTMVDYMDYDDRKPKKNFWGKVVGYKIIMKRKIFFSFKVLDRNNDSITLEIDGLYGITDNGNTFTLKIGESATFNTKTLDMETIYTITLLEN